MEIDKRMFPRGGGKDLHGPEPRNATHLRIHNSLHQSRGNRRVHAISTRFKDVQSSINRFRLRRAHHSMRHKLPSPHKFALFWHSGPYSKYNGERNEAHESNKFNAQGQNNYWARG